MTGLRASSTELDVWLIVTWVVKSFFQLHRLNVGLNFRQEYSTVLQLFKSQWCEMWLVEYLQLTRSTVHRVAICNATTTALGVIQLREFITNLAFHRQQ